MGRTFDRFAPDRRNTDFLPTHLGRRPPLNDGHVGRNNLGQTTAGPHSPSTRPAGRGRRLAGGYRGALVPQQGGGRPGRPPRRVLRPGDAGPLGSLGAPWGITSPTSHHVGSVRPPARPGCGQGLVSVGLLPGRQSYPQPLPWVSGFPAATPLPLGPRHIHDTYQRQTENILEPSRTAIDAGQRPFPARRRRSEKCRNGIPPIDTLMNAPSAGCASRSPSHMGPRHNDAVRHRRGTAKPRHNRRDPRCPLTGRDASGNARS